MKSRPRSFLLVLSETMLRLPSARAEERVQGRICEPAEGIRQIDRDVVRFGPNHGVIVVGVDHGNGVARAVGDFLELAPSRPAKIPLSTTGTTYVVRPSLPDSGLWYTSGMRSISWRLCWLSQGSSRLKFLEQFFLIQVRKQMHAPALERLATDRIRGSRREALVLLASRY